MEKRRLGRGLDSLIPTDPPAPAGGVEEIELSRIELNPKQPRESMDPGALGALADSIRSAGILQPVVVRQRGEMYELVVGERRLKAAQIAGLERIPAVVREVPDDELLELALIENVHREDLNAIEKARAIRRMIQELNLTQEQVGRKLALERPTITNLLRLLELPELIQQMVSRGTLTAGHARALLALGQAAEMLTLARKVERLGLSVRQTERLVAAGPRARHRPFERSPQVRLLEERLRESLGAKVEIRRRGERGRIVVHFHGAEDFERLFGLMNRPGGQQKP